MICSEEDRQKLYEEVWAEPMTVVSKRYALSDNGLRKRCRSWGIPLPTVGYWAKKRSDKPVAEKPPLPPLTQVIHELASDDRISFSFDGSDEELFDEWCSTLKVPAQIKPFDALIEKHIEEMAARQKKAKYAFVKELPLTEQWQYDRDYSRKNQVVAITVSKLNQKRAYRFMHYFFQCIRKINGEVSVKWGEEDNTTIRIGYIQCNCSLHELTTKRRNLGMVSQSMRPVYEELYNGLLEFTIQETENHYSTKDQPLFLSYSDQEGYPLEAQLGGIFSNIYNHISPTIIAEKNRWAEQEKRHAEALRLEQVKQEAINAQRVQEEQKRKQKELLAFANRHMAKWRQSAYFQEYLIELRSYADTMEPDEGQKILEYCQAVERCIMDKEAIIEEILLRL